MVEQQSPGNSTGPLRRMLVEQRYSSAVAAGVGGIYLQEGGRIAAGQLQTLLIISSRLQYLRQHYLASFQRGRGRRKVTGNPVWFQTRQRN
eukprot:5070105-Pyramimonas_sp.AAC.1